MALRTLILAGMVLVYACQHGHDADENDPVDLGGQEVFGNRFKVVADLYGKGTLDTVTEVYFSRLLGRETAKFMTEWSYDSLVKRSYELDPLVLLHASSAPMDTLDQRGHGFGLALLVNEGDLNGDGGDELGYVLDHADWSSLNTYRVIGLVDGRWKELFAFPIWDWQLPALPGYGREYGNAGQTDRAVDTSTDARFSADLVIPVRPGLVKAVGNIGDATLDTMEIHFGNGHPVRITSAFP